MRILFAMLMVVSVASVIWGTNWGNEDTTPTSSYDANLSNYCYMACYGQPAEGGTVDSIFVYYNNDNTLRAVRWSVWDSTAGGTYTLLATTAQTNISAHVGYQWVGLPVSDSLANTFTTTNIVGIGIGSDAGNVLREDSSGDPDDGYSYFSGSLSTDSIHEWSAKLGHSSNTSRAFVAYIVYHTSSGGQRIIGNVHITGNVDFSD